MFSVKAVRTQYLIHTRDRNMKQQIKSLIRLHASQFNYFSCSNSTFYYLFIIIASAIICNNIFSVDFYLFCVFSRFLCELSTVELLLD